MYYWAFGARAWMAGFGYVPLVWSRPLAATVESCRDADGGILAKGPWKEGGRVYATAISVLALSGPYREPPPPLGRGITASAFRRTKSRVLSLVTETATWIYLEARASVTVRSTGAIVAWPNGWGITASGTKDLPAGVDRLYAKAPFGCLLGRIGTSGKLFPIKDGKLTAPESGHLHLVVNDARPADNEDNWTVTLTLR